MNKVRTQIVCAIMLLAGLVSCEVTPIGPHTADKGWDSVFVTGRIRCHGQYYPNIGCNVLSVDLLSRGLEFDSLDHISGKGVNLYLSDVFVPLGDSTLTSGIYTIDTTGTPYTIVPAVDFHPGLTGAYMVRFVGTAVTDTVMFADGEMTVTQWADSLMIECAMRDARGGKYKAQCVMHHDR